MPDPSVPPRPRRPVVTTLALGLLAASTAWFADYAARLGWSGLTGDLWPESRFDPPGVAVSAAIFVHMLAGGVITLLAPLQAIPALRLRAPGLHRWSGRLIVAAALLTAGAGLVWIAAQGTIGGRPMSVAFALYGALMAMAAGQTWRFARARDFARHRAWAFRLIVLALASWIYRVHYGIWYAVTGGVASTDEFSGAFDLVQNWAFYLPYLALLELWLWGERRRAGVRRASS